MSQLGYRGQGEKGLIFLAHMGPRARKQVSLRRDAAGLPRSLVGRRQETLCPQLLAGPVRHCAPPCTAVNHLLWRYFMPIDLTAAV